MQKLTFREVSFLRHIVNIQCVIIMQKARVLKNMIQISLFTLKQVVYLVYNPTTDRYET